MQLPVGAVKACLGLRLSVFMNKYYDTYQFISITYCVDNPEPHIIQLPLNDK
jgi:hypothetical protein